MYSGRKISLYLEVQDPDSQHWQRFEVSYCGLSFAINKIPMATCTLATGRDLTTLVPAAVHSRLGLLQRLNPARIWLTVTGDWGGFPKHIDPGAWTRAGRQLIFEGYVTSPGIQRNYGRSQMSVQLIHWLADLAVTSAISESTHPTSAMQFSWAASYGNGSQTAARSHFISHTVRNNILTPPRVQSDLWGLAIQPMLRDVAKSDPIPLGANCRTRGDNEGFTLKALNRIEGSLDTDGSGTPRQWSPPLRFTDWPADIAGPIAESIAQTLQIQTLQSFWEHTLWDKLVGRYHPEFWFHVVPRVTDALIVPFTPGLRSTWRKPLLVEDSDKLSMEGYNRRPLRGVGVSGGHRWETAANGTDPTRPAFQAGNGIGGCFLPDPNQPGIILLQQGPRWLQEVPAYSLKAGRTSLGSTSGRGRAVTSSNFTTGGGNLRGGDGGETPAEVVARLRAGESSGSLPDRIAQTQYLQEVLRGRQASVSSKLRFDIAPGSTVQMSCPSDAHIPRDDLAEPMVGSVMRVVHMISSDPPHASTQFSLAHLRSIAQNEDPRYSTDRHPLYQDVFTGAPLVDDLLFD